MDAKVLTLTWAPPSSPYQINFTINRVSIPLKVAPFKSKSSTFTGLRRLECKEQLKLEGLPKEYYDDRIEEAAEKGELTEIVLFVIWNLLDLAGRDEEKDVIRSLDLLYRRVEQKGPFRRLPELEDPFLRIDFIREVDESFCKRSAMNKMKYRLLRDLMLNPLQTDLSSRKSKEPYTK